MKAKVYLAWMLSAAVLTLSGCGNASLDDQFVFGKNRITCDNETVTLAVPFEMGISGQMTDLAPKDLEKVNAEGHNRYMQVLVTGETSRGRTADTEAAAAESLMQGNPSVTKLKTDREDLTIAGHPGKRLTFTFTDTEKGRATDLTVREYIFEQDRTIWRVIYQYRTEDPVGKALVARIEGKIEKGATF